MRWTKKNKKKLRKLLTARRPLQEIADFFGTTINSITNIRGRIQYQLFCMECGKPVKNGAKRCPQCSRQNTLRMQKEKFKNKYHNNKKFKDKYLHNRNEQRFGSKDLREKIISRDKSKCVVCGMTRQEHYKKYNIDLKVCSIRISKKTKKPKTDITKLETLCLECQGRKRVKKRTKDYSMTGGGSHKNNIKIKIRCYNCKECFNINYNPLTDKYRWAKQKCKFCDKLLYQKENI